MCLNLFIDFTVFSSWDRHVPENIDWSSDSPDSATSKAPWRVYNIGNNNPVELLDYIDALEESLGIEVVKEGVKNFAEWYKEYHKV